MTPSCTQGVRPCLPPQPCDPPGDGDWFASLRGHSSWAVLSPTSVFQASGIQAWKDVGTWRVFVYIEFCTVCICDPSGNGCGVTVRQPSRYQTQVSCSQVSGFLAAESFGDYRWDINQHGLGQLGNDWQYRLQVH